MATHLSGHVAFDRIVFTYEPDGIPLGIVTGFIADACFFIEHVHVFQGAPASTLIRMLNVGKSMAWAYGCTRIAAHHTKDHPNAEGLDVLARRYGMTPYCEEDQTMRHWALWRE